MNYAPIKWVDIANGEGVRISLFVSGCTHRCKNCFNEVAWDFSYGAPFDESVQNQIFAELASSFISGISLLGGEPLEPQNQEALYPFVKAIKERFPDKTIWCYTGFDYEKQLMAGLVGDKDLTLKCLELIDVLVDGKFVEELKSPALLFRGSSNQRIIDLKKSLSENKVIWLEGVWERKMGSGNIYE